MTNSIGEIPGTDAFFIIGSNTTETHPVIGSKIRKAVRENGAKLIVADPREIDIAKDADVYLQLKPGTNVALINGMMHIILEEGLQDDEFINERTEGYEDLVEILKPYTPEVVAEICNLDKDDIIKAARIYGSAGVAAIYYAMGITQHTTGTNGVMSLSNLGLLTGNIGKESGGINPLRGQNNVQGACDMGGLPGDYPGYQKVHLPAVKEKFENAWGTELSDKAGLTLSEVFNVATDGDIGFLYIMGENPMVSDPDINHVIEALNTIDFVVVQDIFMTETAEFADVILPAASFAEKEGTFTNTERRVLRVRKGIEPLPGTKPDWQILMELSTLLGYDEYYSSPSEIFDELASVTPSYGGLSHKRLDTEGGIQWPAPTKDHPGTKFLHKEAPARGKGLFVPIDYVESNETPDDEFPLIMTTGRILYHYHTRTMTGKIDGLNEISGTSYIEVNPVTARKLNIEDGEMVRVSSRRGDLETAVKITDIIDDDIVFMPFHFAEGAANVLTNNALDPIAKIPELKVATVNISKIS